MKKEILQFSKASALHSKGMVFHGPPGTSKTSGSELLAKYLGAEIILMGMALIF